MPEEIKQEVVLKTQKYLGKYVKKPPLSDKLLKKPPFRFLHDVINSVIKETGFLKGLFSDEELNSENVKEKDAKLAFLAKLIDAVKIITNTDLAVRPSKIVAGLEPTETNLLLQAIGKAIDKKLDSSEYVNQLRSGQIINDKNKKTKKSSEKNEKIKKSSKTETNNQNKTETLSKSRTKEKTSETPKSTDRDKTKVKRASKESKNKADEPKTKNKEKVKKKEKNKETKEEIISQDLVPPTEKENNILTPLTLQSNADTNRVNDKHTTQHVESNIHIEQSIHEESSNKIASEETAPNIDISESVATNETKTENDTKIRRNTSASRPKSARPKSGDLKEKVVQDNTQPVQIQSRPRSSLRPPSVRPSSARPGAPRLRPDSGFPLKEVVPMGKINVIIENFDKDDEEETVVIQSNPEVVEEHDDTLLSVPGENKGHLVEQILEQISESDNQSNKTVEAERQNDIFYGKDTTTKETNNLRALIQSLTKTANPLGKLLNYLHEDIDAMQAELESWTQTKRQLFNEISKQKKISTEMNKPLIVQLDHLNAEIKKIEEELVNTRNNIQRNDIKIKELLSK